LRHATRNRVEDNKKTGEVVMVRRSLLALGRERSALIDALGSGRGIPGGEKKAGKGMRMLAVVEPQLDQAAGNAREDVYPFSVVFTRGEMGHS